MYFDSGFNIAVFIFYYSRQVRLKPGLHSILNGCELHFNNVWRHVFVDNFRHELVTAGRDHQEIEILAGQSAQLAFDSVTHGQAFRDGLKQSGVIHG
jgi:hypothetical protein